MLYIKISINVKHVQVKIIVLSAKMISLLLMEIKQYVLIKIL